MTFHLHLMTRLRTSRSTTPSSPAPIRRHDVKRDNFTFKITKIRVPRRKRILVEKSFNSLITKFNKHFYLNFVLQEILRVSLRDRKKSHFFVSFIRHITNLKLLHLTSNLVSHANQHEMLSYHCHFG